MSTREEQTKHRQKQESEIMKTLETVQNNETNGLWSIVSYPLKYETDRVTKLLF